MDKKPPLTIRTIASVVGLILIVVIVTMAARWEKAVIEENANSSEQLETL